MHDVGAGKKDQSAAAGVSMFTLVWDSPALFSSATATFSSDDEEMMKDGGSTAGSTEPAVKRKKVVGGDGEPAGQIALVETRQCQSVELEAKATRKLLFTCKEAIRQFTGRERLCNISAETGEKHMQALSSKSSSELLVCELKSEADALRNRYGLLMPLIKAIDTENIADDGTAPTAYNHPWD